MLRRPATTFANTTARRVLRTSRQSRRNVSTPGNSTAVRCDGRSAPFSPRPLDAMRRRFSVGRDGQNGASSVLDSSAATARWKRDHYRRIEDKFSPESFETSEEGGESSSEMDVGANATTAAHVTSAQQWEATPPTIDDYDDVQPMWKEMESRVTRRRSLTHEQRGGVSGRRNVRRSDEDMWLEAGVYDDDDGSKKE